MKKVVRDIKRGVNKKVLKVPGIEQKVLDATSNEGWGPHAISLGDIAQASRNYHDYQIIMSVIWKRINDTGKNWRHVYKALTVLEYLVANGSERVVYDIREHAYQISTLSDFQYTDSSGKDQGLNVRRKSQNLVALVNDKELISEVRQKAAANRDKFGNALATGGSNRPGGYGDKYDANVHDGRHGSKDDHGYGREKETGYRSDDHNSRNGDSQSHDGDWNSADHGERNGRDSNRQDDHQYDSRSRSSDADSQRSSQGMARRFSEQNLAPPSYEEAVTESQIPEHSKRDSETQSTSAPTHSSPTISNSGSSPKDDPDLSAPHVKQDFASFDEFDPRGSVQATTASTAANNAEVDLLGFSDPFDSNPLAITQAASTTTVPEPLDPGSNGMGLTFGAAAASNFAEQSFDDPFGDSPFKALPSSESTAPTPSPYEVAMNESNNHHHPQMSGQEGTVPHFDFGNYASSDSQFPSHDQSNPDEEIDILADILPLTGPPPVSAPQTSFSAPPGHSTQSSDHFYGDFSLQGGNPSSPFSAFAGLPSQTNDGSHGDYSSKAQTAGSPFSATSGPPAQSSGNFNSDFHSQASPFSAPHDQYTNDFGDFGALAVVQAQNEEQFNHGSIQQQTGAPPSQFDAPSSDPPHPSPNNYGGFGSQAGLETPVSSQMLPQAQNGMGMHFEHNSGTSLPFSAPSVQPPVMPPQAQHATSVQFNQGNLQHESGTSLPFSSPTVQPPQMLPQSQNGTMTQFNQGNFQHESGTSLPFSAPTAQPPQMLTQSQNGTMMQHNQGNFQNGSGTSLPFSVSSVQPPQMRPQSQNGTELPFNQGQPQNQAGPPAFSAPSLQPAQPYPNTGTPQHPFLPQTSQPPHSSPNMFGDFGSQAGSAMSQAPNVNFQPHSAPSYATAAALQSQYTQALQPNNGTAFPQYGSTAPPTSQFASRGIQPSGGSLPHMGSQMPSASSIRKTSSGEFSQDQGQQTSFGTNDLFGDWAPQSAQGPPGTSQPTVSSSSGALAIVPQASSNKKFETKSTVWADTLSRGLVDLNISGPKANPMSDLGIDFDTMNRKEKRMEKPKPTPAVSTITMGKAMGSGTGMGRAGASTLRPASNPMPGSGIGMGPGTGMGMVGGRGSGMGMGQSPPGMGIGQNPGMGIGGYGSMNPQTMMNQGYNMGMNQGYNNMGMNQGYNNNMGMGMGMNQGYNPMQQPGGSQNMPSGYNPMMGAGGVGGGYPQQPYGGGGYR